MNDADLSLTDTSIPFSFEINWKQIAGFAVFGIIVALLSDVSSMQGGFYWAARVCIASLLVISVFSPVWLGLIIFCVLLFVGIDTVQTSSEEIAWGITTTAGVWNLNIGPIRPSLIVAACCLVHIIKVAHLELEGTVKLALIWFVTVPVLTGFIYWGSSLEIAMIEVPVDLKFGIMLLLSIILFRSLLVKYPQYLTSLIAVFIGCLLSRHFVDLIYWLMGYGPFLSGLFPRASVDSAKGGVIFLLLYSIYLTFAQKKFLIGPIIGISSCLLLIVYATRGLWLTAFLGCALLLYILGVRWGIITVLAVVLAVFGSVKLVQKFQPESVRYLATRAESFTPVPGVGNYLEKLDPIRYREIFNSFDTSFRRGAILWGSGYGSYYTDDVMPFPAVMIDAFAPYSAVTGKFYRAHDYFLHVLFKHGLIGLTIITALWLVPGWRCYKLLRVDRTLMGGTLACLVAFLITGFYQLYWSGKGLLFNGFIIAVLYSFAEQYKQSGLYATEEEQHDTLSA